MVQIKLMAINVTAIFRFLLIMYAIPGAIRGMVEMKNLFPKPAGTWASQLDMSKVNRVKMIRVKCSFRNFKSPIMPRTRSGDHTKSPPLSEKR